MMRRTLESFSLTLKGFRTPILSSTAIPRRSHGTNFMYKNQSRLKCPTLVVSVRETIAKFPATVQTHNG